MTAPRRTLLLLLPPLAVVLAACGDDQLSRCFESNASRYPFSLPGDTAAVFNWPAARQPVRVYAEPRLALPANVDTALGLWVNALRCGELSAQRVADSGQADIIVRNPDNLPPLAEGSITLAADSLNACRGRTDGELGPGDTLTGPLRSYIVPNTTDSTAMAACFRFVTAHEIGHALGLLQHSPWPDDLMYTQPRRRLLTLNDRYTVQTLYHRAATIAPPPR